MDYRNFLTQHRIALEDRFNANHYLRPHDVFQGVDFDEDNRTLFAWAQQQRLITQKDIRDAHHRANIVATLGECPNTPAELVQIMGEKLNVKVSFNGAITRLDITTGQRRDILNTDFARECRGMNAALKIGFNRADIDDAAEHWYQEQRHTRLTSIRAHIAPRVNFDWLLVARSCFDCSNTSPEFVAAVLRKFVHQVVCKLHGKPVGHHLMPVLTGRQGSGKTYFLNHLFGPLSELTRSADFRAISEERNIDLWRSFIICIDEMGYAVRADVDVVKNVITAETLDRRPMRTNAIQTVRQSATLIGASNKKLGELIRDETGNRRFVGIEYSPPADRDFIASLDWNAAWQSIKHTDADPMEEHRQMLKAVQEQDRHYGPVEGWLRALSSGSADLRQVAPDGKLRTKDLYEAYLSHRRTVVADHDPTPRTFDAFSKEMARIIDHHPDICPLTKARDSAGIVWNWSGSKRFALVRGGRS